MREFGRHDHVCWSYAGTAELRVRMREYISEGLAGGERVRYVGSGARDALIDDVYGTEGIEVALDAGAVQVVSLEEMCPDGVVDLPEHVRALAAAAEQAVAGDYAGLRVVVAGTSLVRTPEQLGAVLRYEHLVDRYTTTHPLSVMCAYDVTRLGEPALAQLAGVHPSTNLPGLFRLHASQMPGCDAEMSGELDFSTLGLLTTLLERAGPRSSNGELVVYAARLTFIDHQSMSVLAAHAARTGSTLVLRTRLPSAARMAALLEIPNVRVEEIT